MPGGFAALEQRPGTDILIPRFHALAPIGPTWRRGYAPAWQSLFVHHRTAWPGVIASKGGVPEDLLGNLSLCRNATRLVEVHLARFWRRKALQPVDVLAQRIDRCRAIQRTAALHARPGRPATLDTQSPVIHRHAVGQADVGNPGHAQPGIRQSPAQ